MWSCGPISSWDAVFASSLISAARKPSHAGAILSSRIHVGIAMQVPSDLLSQSITARQAHSQTHTTHYCSQHHFDGDPTVADTICTATMLVKHSRDDCRGKGVGTSCWLYACVVSKKFVSLTFTDFAAFLRWIAHAEVQ